VIISSLVAGLAEQAHVKEFANTTSAALSRLWRGSSSPYKRWILSKGFLREKDPDLKKLQEFDEKWFQAHKIETRFAQSQHNSISSDVWQCWPMAKASSSTRLACDGQPPVRPPVAGVNLGNVIYLRTVRDALALKEMATVERGSLSWVADYLHARQHRACG